MSSRTAVEFLLLAAIWGASFLFMRLAAPVLGPVPLMLLRCAIGAVTLLPFLVRADVTRALFGNAPALAAVGVINSAIPFVLLGAASLVLSAGVTSILNSLAPLWSALIAWAWFADRLDRWQLLGLVFGCVGVVVLVGAGLDPETVTAPSASALALSVGAGLLATLAYGVGANAARRYLQGVPPLAVAAGSQLSATAALLVPGLYFWPNDADVSIHVWIGVAMLGVVCTGFAYLLFFRLIATLGATRAITVTFVIPVFGVGWGVWLLDERITVGTVLGASIIVTGTSLVTRVLRPRLRRTAV